MSESEDFIDCTQDDSLVEDTDNGPDPEVDGDQSDVDQDPINEDDAASEVEVEEDPVDNLPPLSDVPPGAVS